MQPADKLSELPVAGDICLLEDRLRMEQQLLNNLNGRLVWLVREKNVSDNHAIDGLGIDTDLLDRVKEIFITIGREIADWAEMTIATLAMFIQDATAEIGLRQKKFA